MQVHAIGSVDCAWMECGHFATVLVGENELRPHPDPAAGDRRRDVGHLDWCCGHEPLPDATEKAAGPAWNAKAWGRVGGHVAGKLLDADAGAAPQPKTPHPGAEPVHSQPVGNRLEINVAASLQPVAVGEPAILVAVVPAM